jgi:transposase
MYINYREAIRETSAELARLERTERRRRGGDRIKLLRLLKTGEESSLTEAAAVLGYSERQAQRWWKCYREGGLSALRSEPATRGGGQERMTAEAWAALNPKMEAGDVARLRDVRDYLKDQFDIEYTVGAVSKLFQRHKVKLKTGRPRHRRADAEQQAAFKKSAPGTAPPTGRAAGVRL